MTVVMVGVFLAAAIIYGRGCGPLHRVDNQGHSILDRDPGSETSPLQPISKESVSVTDSEVVVTPLQIIHPRYAGHGNEAVAPGSEVYAC